MHEEIHLYRVCCLFKYAVEGPITSDTVPEGALWDRRLPGGGIRSVPVGAGRKVEATRKGGLPYSHKGDLRQPQEELWS